MIIYIYIKVWEDLLSGHPFKKSDIITLQDPHNPTNQNEFDNVKNKRQISDQEKEKIINDPLSSINLSATGGAEGILKKISDKVSL